MVLNKECFVEAKHSLFIFINIATINWLYYPDMNAEEFVKRRFPSDLEDFKKRNHKDKINHLSVFEKTLIYKYTLDGYEELNEDLLSGKNPPYKDLLNGALDKLPDYDGIVFRGTQLSKKQTEKYINAEQQDTVITEPAFISCSKERKQNNIVRMYYFAFFLIQLKILKKLLIMAPLILRMSRKYCLRVEQNFE